MADALTQNGLSTGPLNAAPDASFPSIVGTGTRPVDVIRRAQQSIQTVGVLQYPSDLPKYYMGFQVEKYTRDSLLSVGFSTPLNQVALPFPDRMVDNNQVAYDKKAFSATIGSAVNAGFGAVKDVQNTVASPDVNGASIVTALGRATRDVGVGAAAGLAPDALTAATGDQGRALLGAAGYSPNYFLTVVLDGPQYKQYNCTWTMAPRDPGESATLRQIIRVFEDAMAPGLALGGALFSFPRVFRNYYAPNPGYLYQFKPSVLMAFSVDYTPGGAPSMKRRDPETAGWEAPTALRVSATFMELEFWLRGDYGDATPGATPNQGTSNSRIPLGAGNPAREST